jgi:hypothetical protein
VIWTATALNQHQQKPLTNNNMRYDRTVPVAVSLRYARLAWEQECARAREEDTYVAAEVREQARREQEGYELAGMVVSTKDHNPFNHL